MNTAGSYEFIDSDTIRIEMSGLLSLGGAQVFDVQINGDTMTLSNGMITTRYRRVQ